MSAGWPESLVGALPDLAINERRHRHGAYRIIGGLRRRPPRRAFSSGARARHDRVYGAPCVGILTPARRLLGQAQSAIPLGATVILSRIPDARGGEIGVTCASRGRPHRSAPG